MPYRDYDKITKFTPFTLSERPLPPMYRLHTYTYPDNVECSYRSNTYCSACLILKGGMTFQERGFPEFHCEAGRLALVPSGCVYCWRIDEETETFQCLHGGFSIYEHSELSILFGLWQRRVSSVLLGMERVNTFMRRIDDLAQRHAPEIRYSIATLDLLADAVELLGGRKTSSDSEDLAPIVKCVYFIESNLARETTVRELAKSANVSESRLFQLFQKSFSLSPMQYVAKRKTDEAKRLLTSSSLSIGEIAGQLGFNDANYFTRFFRKHANTTPGALRKQEKLRIIGGV